MNSYKITFLGGAIITSETTTTIDNVFRTSMGDASFPAGTVVFYNNLDEPIAIFHEVKSCVKINS